MVNSDSDSAGITDENRKRELSKKYGKNGILYEKKYCRKIKKTYPGTQTPRMEKTVQKASKKVPLLRAAVMPKIRPTAVPMKMASPPMRNELEMHWPRTVLMGAP